MQCTWPIVAPGDFAEFQTDGPTSRLGSKFAEFFSYSISLKKLKMGQTPLAHFFPGDSYIYIRCLPETTAVPLRLGQAGYAKYLDIAYIYNICSTCINKTLI